jgi:DNA-binding MarR family transcriptional regulator
MGRTQPEGSIGSVAFLVAQVGARAAEEFAQSLAALKFAPCDAGILRLLKGEPGMSQQDLAGRLEMHASRLVAVIDALESKGLVAREANAQDRRTYSLKLTVAGDEAMQQIGQVAQRHNEAVCSGLDAGERNKLAELLGRIAAQYELRPGVHPGYKKLGRKVE